MGQHTMNESDQPLSKYAKKKRANGHRGPPGDQRPLLDGPRLALTQCTCPPGNLCHPCFKIVQALKAPTAHPEVSW